MFYNLTNRAGQSTLSVFGEFGEKVIPANHPFFQDVLVYLTTNEEHDENEIVRLIDPTLHIGEQIKDISDRVTYDRNNIYLDGLPVHSSIGQHIVERIEAREESWDRLVRFLVKVSDNPSKRSQDAVYEWIQRHSIQITEDGDFVGYKGVTPDGLSVHSGPNNFIDGVLYGEAGKDYQVPHEVGTVISKRRGDVDDNTALACATGLHVGTHSYATGFGKRLLTVKVNPANVVSVPSNESTFKIRVCEYEVIALNEAQTEFSGYTYDVSMDGTDYVVTDDTFDHALDAGASEQFVEVSDEGEMAGATFNLTPEEQAELSAVIAADREAETADEEYPREEALGSPETVSQALTQEPAYKTLAEAAEAIPALSADLNDTGLGHKEVARKWSEVTTESSVRRWRKSHGVKPLTALKKFLG